MFCPALVVRTRLLPPQQPDDLAEREQALCKQDSDTHGRSACWTGRFSQPPGWQHMGSVPVSDVDSERLTFLAAQRSSEPFRHEKNPVRLSTTCGAAATAPQG